MKNKFIILILFLSPAFFMISAQGADPYKLLDEVKNHFSEVEDYSVDASINIDVNFLKVPESKAKIYFKQPDKIKMESDGFALLPKQGINFAPSKLLKDDYTAIYIRAEQFENKPVSVIKVVPNNDKGGIILSTLWVDDASRIIRKVETTTREAGTIELILRYNGNEKIGLPSEAKFSFKVNSVEIPAAISGEFANPDENKSRHSEKDMSGTVVIKYSNYKINIGLKADFFSDSK